jgi:uncharacterized protein YhjY with autotransporter beta-barrel domain
MLIASAALAPVTAQAQSSGCARVNQNSLNYFANYNAGNLDSSNARVSSANSDQAFNAIRITATNDQTFGAAAYDTGGSFAFAVGDVLNLTITANNVTAPGALVRFRTGTTATSASDVTTNDAVVSSSGAVTRSYTVNGGETSIGVRINKSGGMAPTGNFTLATTCTPAPQAAIANITPNTVQAGISPGSVTITGINFSTSGNAVTFTDPGTGAAMNAPVSAESATSITVTGPISQSAGVSTVRVTTASGQTDTETFNYRPGVTSVAGNGGPNGPPGGGNSVVLTGVGLGGTTAVNFGATAATAFTVNSNTQITATAPAGSGSVNITVTSRGVTSTNTATYNYILPAPTVTSIGPTGGSTGGGTPVTITGTNFVSGNTYIATFGVTAVAATYASATTLAATTPAGTGTVAVTVTNTTTSQTGTGSASYTYAAPVVNALSASAGPAGQTRQVTITGMNFTPTATVAVGGTAATGVAVNSATQITATLPAKAAGTYDVQVTTGTVTSAANPPRSSYTYIAAPTVTSVTPTSGSTAGGTAVTIGGSNLAGATAVTFGGNPTTNVVVAGDGNSLTATTPAGAAGATTVSVTTPGGTGQLAGGYTYVTLAPPAVTGQPQSQTVAAGQTATFSITASGSPSPAVQWQVSSDSGASFANVAANGNGTSYTTPVTVAADNGKQYRAVLTNSQGIATSAAATLTVVQAPTANNQSVAVAYQTARAITLTGNDPNNPARTLTYTVATAPTHGTLSGTTPNLTYTPTAGYVGPDSFTFTVSNGVSTSAPATVTITVQQPLPVVNAISPAQGPAAGGTAVAIVGTGFTGATSVTVGGTAATDVTVQSDTRILATTPAGTIGLASVVVTNTTGGNPANTLFRYVGTPTANDQSVSTGFNTARAITLTGSDPNMPARALSFTVATNPAHGTLSGTAPNLVYTPTANYIGQDSFTFTVRNDVSTSAPATVSITVGAPAAPAAPVVTAPANGSVTNDTTPTVTGTTAAGTTVAIYFDGTLSGAATVTGTGFSYTPATALGQGSHTVYAQATNAGGPSPNSNTNTFTVDSVAPAAPTIAAPANGSTTGTRRPAITGSAESGTIVTVTINGSVAGNTVATGGGYSFTPTADLPVGSNTVSVVATDAAGNQSPAATSSFTVVAQPSVTGVLPAEGTTAGGTTITVTGTNLIGVTGVLVGGNPATNIQVASNTQLTAVTPSTSAAGAAQVSVSNQAGTSTTNGTFTYVAPPVADNQTIAAAYNSAGSSNRTTVVLSASNNPTSYEVLTAPQHGSLTGTAPNLTYIASNGYIGSDSFTFRASNAAGNSNTATVTLNVAAPTIAVGGTTPAGTRGTAYGATLTVSGGTAPYSIRLTAGALPAGLTLSTSSATTATISGTPTASGTFTGTITATDSSNPTTASGSYSFSITIAGPTATISPPAGALPGGTVGFAYSQTFTTNGATAPYTYALTAGTLPAGMTLAANGSFSGTPTMAGSYSFSVTSTDSSSAGSGGPYTATASYTLSIAAPVIVVQPATLPASTVGVAYSQTFTASGGTGPYSYAVTAGALPAGMTLASNGTFGGTPTAGGSFGFTVTATDSSTGTGAPFSGSRAYTFTVQAATITVAPTALPVATGGQAYSQQVSASGGTAPYTYTTSGPLSAGLSLSSTGLISGTPTQAGSFTFTVTATDSSTGGNQPGGRYAGQRSYTLTVAAPTIAVAPASAALPNGTVGIAYSQTFTATGGTGPYTYTLAAGAIPAGMTLTTGGQFSGTPTAGGSFTFTVRATDAAGFSGDRAYTLGINAPNQSLAPPVLPDGTRNVAYSQQLTASGGTAPYSYRVAAGTLPSGLTLSSSGVISGTPSASGSFTFTASAIDSSTGSGPFSVQRTYTVAINAPAITIAPATLPAATTRIAYSQQLSASGGTAPYTFAVTAGTLPAGLTLVTDGTLAGSATAMGSYSFTVTATDANGNTGARGYTLVVNAPAITLAPAALPDTTVGSAYSQAIIASGGSGGFTYAVTAGALPAGLTLSTGGTLSGTATAGGTFTFTVSVTDANGNTGSRAYTLAVGAPTIAIASDALPAATTRIAYSQQLTATGGTAPYSYAVTAGALPAGITLAANGTLSGTATTAGSYTFSVSARDASTGSGPYTGTRSYTLVVSSPAIVIAPATLPEATTRIAYSQALTATGGTAPYGFAITAGALPQGLTLSSSGTLAGTPTTAGSFTFTATATDANGNTGTRSYTLTVVAPAIVLAPATLQNARTGQAYSQALTATGGTAPYGFAITGGALPAGITIGTTGTLSGTPTAGGTYTFTATATDANGNTGTRSYTLVSDAAQITVAPTTLPAGQVRAASSQALTATGGTAPYTYVIVAGTPPAGLTLATSGTLSGTPIQSGSFTFTVAARDSSTGSGPYTGTRSYTLAIDAPTLTLAPDALPGTIRGAAYSQTLTTTGGTAPYTYAATGTLPPGLTLSTSGVLQGRATAVGSYSFTVTATDATTPGLGGPYSTSRAYAVEVTVPTIALAPETLPGATTRIAYSQAITASGGTAPYAYAVTAGALPAGITLSTTGTLSGTPTTAGTFNATITATDANGNAGSRPYTLTVTAPAIALAPDTLPAGTTRVAYSQAITASGGTAPYAYAVTAGALPQGLMLATDGTLSGTPTTAGTFNATITATDANGNAGSRPYMLTVTAPTIVLAPDTLPAGTTRVAYRQAVTASGGTAPYAYAVTAGALPPGLTLQADGTLSGTPTTVGSFTFTIAATDANGNGGNQVYTVTIAAPAIVLAPQALPGATAGSAYAQRITATGGTEPLGFAVTAGALPTGVTLATDGTLSGTPTAGGSFPFTATATDANGNTGSRAYTLAVAAPTLVLAPESLPVGQAGTAYAQALATTGGTAPYAYALTAGRLPAGLALSATGTIAGTPTQSGSFPVTVTATDSSTGAGPYTASRSYTLVIAAPALALAPATLGDARVGAAYSATLVASGGTAPYSYRVTAGALPAGITLAVDGTVSGTPNAGGSFGFTVTATDATASGAGGPYLASRSYTLDVAAAQIAVTPETLPTAQQGVAYTATVSATGGVAPYAYAVTAGRLPAGLTLAATGTLSGTPTEAGRFSVSITATDSAAGSGPYSGTRAYTLEVGAPRVPTAGPVSMTVAYNSQNNPVPVVLDGGTATGVAVATQPQHGTATAIGLRITYTPVPGYSGPDSFTYTAGNEGGTSAPATVSVTVSGPTVTINPTTLPDARQGDAYSQQLTATGGAAPYAFTVAGGTLPAGLSLSSAGVLSGTPTAGGSAAFTVRTTDSSTGTGPFSATQGYTLSVALPAAPTIRTVPTIDAAGSSSATSGSTQIVLSDYVSGNVSDIQVTSPPANGAVTLANSAGRIVATYVPRPNYAGRDSFQVVAVGPGGRSAAATVTLQVAGTAPVVTALTATTTQGVPVTVDLSAGATGGPFTAATVVAVSPAGQVTTQVSESGTASARTYGLTLTPLVSYSGTVTVTYTLSNQYGASRPATITLTVAARPDPSADPSVNALSAAQADATRRFVRGQVDNFFRRNERLHNGGTGTSGVAVGNTLGLGLGGMIQSDQIATTTLDMGEMKTLRARGVATPVAGAIGGLPGMTDGMAGRAGAATGGTTAPGTAQATPQAEGTDTDDIGSNERRIGSVGIWSGGAVTVGAWDASTRRAKMAITTGGLSAGADIKLSDALIVGVGGGYGHDATRIDGGKAHVRGDSWSLAGYGSWSPADGLFVDGVAGAGKVSFDTSRRVDATGALALGDRDGRTIFGSLAAGFDRHGKRIDFSAYGRADYLSARLDRFTEVGAGIYDLTFGKRNLDSLTGILGTRVALPMTGVTPRLRAEWRHEFADTGSQLVDYADVANLRYATRGDLWLRDAFTLDLGLDIDLGRGWGLSTEVGAAAGSGATSATGRVGVRKQF